MRKRLPSFGKIKDEGKDVVIIMHTYGGVLGGAAAKRLSKFTRTHEGRRGDVVGLVHISGFVLPVGASVADGQGDQLPERVEGNEVRSPSLRSPSLPSRSS